MGQQALDLGWQGGRVGQIGDADRPAADLVFVGRPDAAAGGADLAGPGPRLARRIQVAVQRQHQAGVVGQHQQVGRDGQTLRRVRRRSRRSSDQGSTTTPLPMTDSLPCTTPDGSSESL